MVDIKIKRAYEPYEKDDGYRVLVDRLWPRGLTKERVHYDIWEKSLAPSSALRKAFGHKPENWEMFKKRYCEELSTNPDAAAFAKSLADGNYKTVTLVYGAKNTKMNQAVVLKHWLDAKLSSKATTKKSA